jgi:hypothetical protein
MGGRIDKPPLPAAPQVVQAPASVRQLWYPQRSVRGYPFERFLFGGKSPEQTHVTVWSGYPHSPHPAFSYCCKRRNMRAARTFNTSRRPTASLSATVHAQVLGQRAACPLVWVGNFHYGVAEILFNRDDLLISSAKYGCSAHVARTPRHRWAIIITIIVASGMEVAQCAILEIQFIGSAVLWLLRFL